MIDYDLHKLGWRAFQDLCAVILQHVLGQTFHSFADSNDAGRDGAFHGQWSTHPPTDSRLASMVQGATVAQCKFSARADGTLSPSSLATEIEKARALHEDGICDAYILLTNLRVTGRTERTIAKQLTAVGIPRSLILDGSWICQQIASSGDLRRYVPRVYGLGDLGKILDERKLGQARALVSRLREDLATFVPTDAYRRAADALHDNGFVLLLGEPAAGKSTIAATLALTALDKWGSSVRRVDSAAELVEAWDPEDPDQLFWIDDAFGSIRHDPMLTDGWVRRMDQVMAAISQGCRVLLTSRDYIYRDAAPFLKEYAHSLLRNQKIAIAVSELTADERRQILYNHLKAGDQADQTLAAWRPHLPALAAVRRFQPEVARRLSYQAFTSSSVLTSKTQLVDYFARPVQFLADVLRQLEPAAQAALACVYMSGNELLAPVHGTPLLNDAVTRLGSSVPDVMRAFPVLEGTFLQNAISSSGEPIWKFRHPTIREGFAAVVAEDVNAVGIFIDGLSDEELLQQVDCGGSSPRGTLVRVPASLYSRVLPRVPMPMRTTGDVHGLNRVASFLRYRCSPEFLQSWSELNAPKLEGLLGFTMYVQFQWEPQLIASLHKAGALPEDIRRRAVANLSGYALLFDGGWLEESICGLFTTKERRILLAEIEAEIIPNLEAHIDDSADGYDSDVESSDRFEMAQQTISNYARAFKDAPSVLRILESAEAYTRMRIRDWDWDHEPTDEERSSASEVVPYGDDPFFRRLSWDPPSVPGRDEFEDVAEGR